MEKSLTKALRDGLFTVYNDNLMFDGEGGFYEFSEQQTLEKAVDDSLNKAIEYGGYTFDRAWDIKPSKSKGKKAVVLGVENGKYKLFHFGDKSMGHNYSEGARKNATARHKKNLEGKDARSKAFRIYWKKYWTKSGTKKSPPSSQEIKKAFEILGIDPIEKAANKTDFTDKERENLAKKKMAMPDGSFPIRNSQDLKDAIKSYGRAKDKEKAKKWIKKRAKELGKDDLIPEKW